MFNLTIDGADESPAAQLDRMEIETMSDLIEAAPEAGANESKPKQLVCDEGIGLAFPPSQARLFNRWLTPGRARPVTQAAIASSCDWMRRNASPVWALDLPSTQISPQVLDWLQLHGLVDSGERIATYWRKSVPVERPSTCEFLIRLLSLGKEGDLREVIERGDGSGFLARWISGLVARPRWHAYVAYDGDTPAALAVMFVKGSHAYLGAAMTAPDYRSRGAQYALLARRIEDARKLGVDTLQVQTTRHGQGLQLGASDRNILRAGFQLSHLRTLYIQDVRPR